MKYLIILATLVFAFGASASEEVTCSKNGTVVLYVNGVWSSDKDAKGSVAALEKQKYGTDLLRKKIDKKVTYDLSYNTSINKLADVFETSAQKLEQEGGILNTIGYVLMYGAVSSYPNTIEEFIKLGFSPEFALSFYLPYFKELAIHESLDTALLKEKIGKHLALDKKLIVVSHSQGNLFVNKAYSEMLLENLVLTSLDKERKFLDFEGLFRNLQVASPANSIAMPGYYLTNSEDKVQLVPGAMKENFPLEIPNISQDLRGLLEHFLNHEFELTYLQPSSYFLPLRNEVAKRIYNEAKELISNCGPPPVANFTATPSPSDPFTYTLDATSGNEIEKFAWTVEEGTPNEVTYTEMVVTHTFTEGSQTVKLVVTDPYGQDSEPVYKKIEVGGNKAPVASFTFTTNLLEVKLDASASVDEDGTIVQYKWVINGTQYNTATPSFTYTFQKAGTYDIRLIAVDNKNKASEAKILSVEVDDIYSTRICAAGVEGVTLIVNVTGFTPFFLNTTDKSCKNLSGLSPMQFYFLSIFTYGFPSLPASGIIMSTSEPITWYAYVMYGTNGIYPYNTIFSTNPNPFGL